MEDFASDENTSLTETSEKLKMRTVFLAKHLMEQCSKGDSVFGILPFPLLQAVYFGESKSCSIPATSAADTHICFCDVEAACGNFVYDIIVFLRNL